MFNREGLSAALRPPCEQSPGPVGICRSSGDHESLQTLQRGLGCSQPPRGSGSGSGSGSCRKPGLRAGAL